jgi:hypothetical protein
MAEWGTLMAGWLRMRLFAIATFPFGRRHCMQGVTLAGANR